MSWSSADLPVVGFDVRMWSVADAALLLDMDLRDVRESVRKAGLAPAGKRFDRGRSTRHVRVFHATELLRVLGFDGEEFGGKVF